MLLSLNWRHMQSLERVKKTSHIKKRTMQTLKLSLPAPRKRRVPVGNDPTVSRGMCTISSEAGSLSASAAELTRRRVQEFQAIPRPSTYENFTVCGAFDCFPKPKRRCISETLRGHIKACSWLLSHRTKFGASHTCIHACSIRETQPHWEVKSISP